MGDLFRSVSREEFADFLASYPRRLTPNVTAICEPPMVSYNDFERAPQWPDSVVASFIKEWSGEDTGHRVIADINSPVPDDGKRDTDKPLTDKDGAVLVEGDSVDAKWGASLVNGLLVSDIRREVICIRDKGTKYEHWSFESCHNIVRGFDMVKVR